MLNRENKTAMTRKGMVSNRFKLESTQWGTASILVGTTLIFGIGSQEAKARRSNQQGNEGRCNISKCLKKLTQEATK